jgi:hypothetical protein
VTEDWAIAAPEAAKTANAYSNYIIHKVVQRCRKYSAHQLHSCALFLYGIKHTTFQIETHQFLQTTQTEMIGKLSEKFANNLHTTNQTQFAIATIQLYAC